MLFKALITRFVENKGQSGPWSVDRKRKANFSNQLNFRVFVSCQLTPSIPSERYSTDLRVINFLTFDNYFYTVPAYMSVGDIQDISRGCDFDLY